MTLDSIVDEIKGQCDWRCKIRQSEAERERALQHVREMVEEYLHIGNMTPMCLVSLEYADIRRQTLYNDRGWEGHEGAPQSSHGEYGGMTCGGGTLVPSVDMLRT
jgi:hypothetical protein